MNAPTDGLAHQLAGLAGPVLFLGEADTGKSTLAHRAARALVAAGTPALLVDGDVGQSEVGPPGMMDLAEPHAEAAPARWRVRGQWYVGATSPYGAMLHVAAGARRLADRAADLGCPLALVDTASFVNAPVGHALASALVDVLRPALVVAVQYAGEMEGWLRGVGAPVARVTATETVRVKPSGLRATRRAARLTAYFREAPAQAVRLAQWPLRDTRMGFGQALAPSECEAAGARLGRTVVHGERAGSSVALWTLGPPRHDPARIAPEMGARRVTTYDASVWTGRGVGFLGADGFCLAMGWIERMDWPALTAVVRVPLYNVAEAVALQLGGMRHQWDGAGLPPVPDRDA